MCMPVPEFNLLRSNEVQSQGSGLRVFRGVGHIDANQWQCCASGLKVSNHGNHEDSNVKEVKKHR